MSDKQKKSSAKDSTTPDDVLTKETTRGGFVAIIGAPNAGKSTLLNKLIGQKISITSPKPQTTRMRIIGVLSEGDTQIAFIDTPGIFAPPPKKQEAVRKKHEGSEPHSKPLDRAMMNAAWGALKDADAIILLVDAATTRDEKTDQILEELQRRQQKVIVALNKVDQIAKQKLLPLAQKFQDTTLADEIFMISAMTGDGLDDLTKHLKKLMPKGPWFFDPDQLSDLPSQILAAEITREQLFRQLQQELPYGATVIPESWETKKDGSAVIRQNIIVARASHKPMVLGAKGTRIKAIGEAARKDISRLMDQKVHLFLEVKVDERWQERAEYYSIFGLEFDKTPAARKK